MSDFGGLALLCPQRMGAQFTRVQLRPSAIAIWTSSPAQFGGQLLGDHAMASCPSMSRLGGRPSSGAHLGPRSATTWIHVNRPHGSTLGIHPAPRSASTSGQLGSHVRLPQFPPPSTSMTRLGGRPNFGSPMETHTHVSDLHPHAVGRPTSDHVSAPNWAATCRTATLRPCIMPQVEAQYCVRVSWIHVYVGTNKTPTPKG